MAERPPQARGETSPTPDEPTSADTHPPEGAVDGAPGAEGADTEEQSDSTLGFGARKKKTGTSSDELPDVEGQDEDQPPIWRRIAAERWGDGPMAGVVGIILLVLATVLTAFQLYVALGTGFDARQQRLLHLMFVMVLVFLILPPIKLKKNEDTGRPLRTPQNAVRTVIGAAIDLVAIGLALVTSLYPIYFQAELASRAGAYEVIDWVMGLLMILVLLEATRRAVGMIMVILVSVFMYYAWVGPLIPGDFGHSGNTIQRISTHSYLGNDGIFGLTLGVVVTFVFVFILFGALLSKTGGGNFFVGLAYVLTGRMVGGPAKGAVLGSAMMGSVSGSAIANVVTTGPFTIPLMKRVGYKRHDAAGVEAAASTGGQVLPPIMGAGAFLMAERLGIPYAEIVKVAIIPALMFFAVMFLFVDILARKHNVGTMRKEDVPSLKVVMKAGWHFLAPLVLLVTLLLNYVHPAQAGLYACGALLIVAMIRASSRLNVRDFFEVFVLAARNTMAVSVACAVAGIIVGVVGLTGLGLVFSDVLVNAFAGSLLLTLIMVALASLILGIGLPVTASYVVLVVLAGPALEELGLALIVAHMIVYWYSQDSNVTPPVAFAAFAAAGIANSRPMRSGVSAWKFAKGLYLIPILMAYSALMELDGPVIHVVIAVVSGSVALAAAAMAIEGFFLRRVMIVERLALILAALLVMIAPEWTSLFQTTLSVSVHHYWFVLVGSVLGAVLIALHVLNHKVAQRAESAAGLSGDGDGPDSSAHPEAVDGTEDDTTADQHGSLLGRGSGGGGDGKDESATPR